MNAGSLNLVNANAPKWQGMEIFKHLDDYKTVNAEDYYLTYEGAPGRVYGSYLFVSDLTNNVQCDLNNKNDPTHSTSCYSSKASKNVLLDVHHDYERIVDAQNAMLDIGGFWNGKKVKILPVGSKIFLPKMDIKRYLSGVKSGLFFPNENYSLTCVTFSHYGVACKNSLGRGFIVDGNDIKAF